MSNNRDPSPPIYSNPINIIGDDETVINLDQDDEFPTPIEEEEPPIYYPTPTTTTSIPTITTNNNNNAINNNNNHILSFPKYSSPNPKKQQQANKKEEEIIELDSEEEEEIDTFSTSTDNTSNNNNQNNKNKRKKKPILEKQFQIELHQKRPCRDFLFFLLFLLFSFGMFLIGIYAFNQRTNRIPSSENGGKEIGLLDIFKSALSLLFGGNNGERKFNILSSVILPQRNEMLSFIYPKDYLGRTCGIDYTKDENVISLMKDINLPDDDDCKVLLNNNNEKSEKCLEKIKNLEKFWREDLTNRKYLWIMNENFNEVKDWIIYGGVCVEQCPSGVLSNNNNNADNNNDNNKADIVENCPNSLLTEEEILIYGNARNLVTNNDTAVGESISNIQNDSVGKELLLKKKVKVCGVKRIGDKEDKIFKVTNDQSYASVMGRCIPLFNNLLNTVNSLTDNNNNIVNMKSSSATATVTASVVSNTARDIIDINNNLDIIKNNIDTKEYILKMYSYLSLLSNYSNNWLENLMIKITTIIYNSWKVLLISFIITISITILFTLFIRFFTKFLIYSITLICSILLFLFSLLFIIKSNTIKNNEILLFTKNKLMPSIFINNNYLSNDNNVYNNLYLTIGIFLLISFIIFIFFIFFKRKEIARSIKIIQESSRMITNIPQMFTIFPIFMFFLTILFYTSWILVVYWMCVNNMSTSLVTNNNNLNNNNYIDYYNKFKTSIYEMKNHLVTGWFGYYLFGYFWITQFILSFITILVARITSLYYFEYNQKSLFDKQLICLTKFPILKNLFFVIYYNIGSIALSSLFVGFVKYLLLVLKLLFGYNNNSKNNNSKNSNNSTFQKLNWLYSLIFENILIKGITFLFFYFLNILEKYVQFFSKNGLIQCAIFGCNFFHGSISSMKLLSKNISLIIVLEYITNIIMFILRLFISISTTLIIYLILTINNDNNAIGYKQLFMINEWLDMKYYPMDLLFILILVFLLSFIIASLFINIFQVVLDTTLQCYLIDLEMKRNGNIKNMSSSKELDDLMEEEKEYNLLESLN
ncbi:hypothetical protein ABK040_007281 [Willaertia magna]